ncbi:MAG: hypothetical protein WBV81_15510 [Ignavibacteriaceae bacterium]
MQSLSDNPSLEEIKKFLINLDERISSIESRLQILPAEETYPVKKEIKELAKSIDTLDREDNLEYRIGQFWFAKVGIVVLIIGLAFLLTLPYENSPSVFPVVLGYFFSAVLIVLSKYFRKNFPHISGFILGGGFVLSYFSTLRLYYFNSTPYITNLNLEVILLIIISGLTLYYSVKKRSVYLTAVCLTLGYLTALVSDQPYFIFIMLTILSALTVYFTLKYKWSYLIVYGVIITYSVHLIWFFNNPLLGKQPQLVSSPEVNAVFLLIYATIFYMRNILRDKSAPESANVILVTVLNTAGAYSLFLLITLTTIHSYVGFYHLLASILFLTFSIIFWVREKSRFSTFILAMCGYLALSVAIVIQFPAPSFFIWLCWQSLLVVSTAVWFRSKFIVLANFIIYLIVLIAYLAMEGRIDAVSISYGIVALLSARILNWKKDRLELRTEYMRNSYLIIALLIIPYALYNFIPGGLVAISWVVLAFLYYTLSLFLKNKKYRWMAIITLLLTVVYVFILGITSEDFTYKIISFLVLGVVLVAVSLIYTRVITKTDAGNKIESDT